MKRSRERARTVCGGHTRINTPRGLLFFIVTMHAQLVILIRREVVGGPRLVVGHDYVVRYTEDTVCDVRSIPRKKLSATSWKRESLIGS